MTIAKKIETVLKKTSWIRKMFEKGAILKAEYGAGNVYDFSLGNPIVSPPESFRKSLLDIIGSSESNSHGYMPNIGYPFVRKSVAEYISKEQNIEITENEIIMTCGAAGGLNIILKAILNHGDEIITPAPYFVEYNFYVDNHGGVLKKVPTNPDFTLNIEAIASCITDKTTGVLINSPNNPTGQIYSEESLKKLAKILTEKSRELDKTVYLIADEPYRKIVYDDVPVPSIFTCYENSIIATSYSKDISIPGERIGFVAVNPSATFKEKLVAGMALSNRILGYVNASALMQRVISKLQGASVDINEYSRKRDLLCEGLADCGYEFIKPGGTFYLFPKAPIADDIEFVNDLLEELVLVVPGSGFGGTGHFRIAFCVEDETIINAIPAFERVMRKYK
mmetsp:Transcript_3505/g.2086  ORF Transcript_3505/g.2086 Transcript_3505/m.2086 type:complete len:394 (-) Transcript_3505:2715-3896(-)